MSGEIFVISDTHFNHKNVIEFGKRPFSSVEEMNETIINLWNAVVTKRDIVIHIGDWGWKVADYSLAQELNGLIRLVMGNHDKYNAAMLKYFHSIHGSLKKHEFLFTHIPIIFDSTRNYDYLIHGHIHDASLNIDDWRYYNANIDAQGKGYQPIPLEEIRFEMKQRKLKAMMGEP